jgi:hypothetical protein
MRVKIATVASMRDAMIVLPITTLLKCLLSLPDVAKAKHELISRMKIAVTKSSGTIDPPQISRHYPGTAHGQEALSF